ncbi:oxoglutarate iron-dependent oxygenase [Diplodia corticola]|uniref:Oxoglutarate iron-dependent oxygenase n=1 Tax=Diplodia corticola TaxID=236234 RepID=A0A1J9S498_9PEZI|nr:oxoglutarate iron-dependent oxygenase [Diplodia corticola]OJD34804.1 oxoglutarate iron-dependent oxygenase [Diplodia corticola]
MPPKGKKKDAAIKPAAAPPEQRPPDWPAFKPLIPPSDLSLQEVVPEQIVTVPNFWPSSLCKTYVSFLSSLPLTTTPGKPKKGDAVRVNDRFQIQDAVFAKRLWEETALKDIVLGNVESEDGLRMTEAERTSLWGGEAVGLNPNIRIYRYSKGQFFDQHYDDFNSVVIPGERDIQARTTWTLLLYLTSPATGCLGGETVFYPDPPKKASKKDPPPEPIVVGLEVGMALLHKHGADCMLHEGREVLEGEKWVIRSDLCVRR